MPHRLMRRLLARTTSWHRQSNGVQVCRGTFGRPMQYSGARARRRCNGKRQRSGSRHCGALGREHALPHLFREELVMAVSEAEGGFNGHPRLHSMTESYTGSGRCFQSGARGTADGPQTQKVPAFQGDSSNVEVALR